MEKSKPGLYAHRAVSLALVSAAVSYVGITKAHLNQMAAAQPAEFSVSMLRAMGSKEITAAEEGQLSKACDDKGLMSISARTPNDKFFFRCDDLSTFIVDQAKLSMPRSTPRNKNNLRR